MEYFQCFAANYYILKLLIYTNINCIASLPVVHKLQGRKIISMIYLFQVMETFCNRVMNVLYLLGSKWHLMYHSSQVYLLLVTSFRQTTWFKIHCPIFITPLLCLPTFGTYKHQSMIWQHSQSINVITVK